MRSLGLLASGPLAVARRALPLVGGALHAQAQDLAPGLHLGAGSLGQAGPANGLETGPFQMRRRGTGAGGRGPEGDAAQAKV